MEAAPSSQALNKVSPLYPPRPASVEAYQSQSTRFRTTAEYRDLWAILLYVAQFIAFLGLSGYAYYNIATNGFNVSTSATSRNATLVKEFETNTKPVIRFAAIYFAVAFVVIGFLCLSFVHYLKTNAKSFYKYSIPISAMLLFAAGGAIIAVAIVKGLKPNGPLAVGIIGIIAAAFLLLTGIFLLLFLSCRACCECCCKQYKELAICIMEITASVMKAYPSLFTVTIGLVLVHLILSIAYFITGVGIYSLTTNGSTGLALSIFFILSYYWTSELVMGVLHVTLSGATAHWYFLEDGSITPSRPVANAFKRATTTSAGSVALGSLLLATIRTVRSVIQSRTGGRSVESCAENFGECVNEYAFVQVAIYGKKYLIAARDTFRLLVRTGLRTLNISWFVGSTGSGLAMAAAGIGMAIVYLGTVFSATPIGLEYGAYYMLVFMVGAAILGFLTMSVLTQIINSVALTTIICLAEDPAALKRTKPDLYGKLFSTFPSLPLWSQFAQNDSAYYIPQQAIPAQPNSYAPTTQQPMFGGNQQGYPPAQSMYPPQTNQYGYPPSQNGAVPNQGYGYPPQPAPAQSYGYPPPQNSYTQPPPY